MTSTLTCTILFWFWQNKNQMFLFWQVEISLQNKKVLFWFCPKPKQQSTKSCRSARPPKGESCTATSWLFRAGYGSRGWQVKLAYCIKTHERCSIRWLREELWYWQTMSTSRSVPSKSVNQLWLCHDCRTIFECTDLIKNPRQLQKIPKTLISLTPSTREYPVSCALPLINPK